MYLRIRDLRIANTELHKLGITLPNNSKGGENTINMGDDTGVAPNRLTWRGRGNSMAYIM